MKVVRNIIRIDEAKCDGCGLCILDCHESAIAIIDGVAKVVKESLCDGLGNCLGACPRDAIVMEQRLADPFDEEEVKKHTAAINNNKNSGCPSEKSMTISSGCPSAKSLQISTRIDQKDSDMSSTNVAGPGHWPLKIKLVRPDASYFQNRDIVIAADCSAFLYPDFHKYYANGTAVIIGCPKFDDTEEYVQKIANIIALSNPKSITVIRMSVPCCAGIVNSVRRAFDISNNKPILKELTINIG